MLQVDVEASDGDAVFIREFTLTSRDDPPGDHLHESPSNHKPEDPVSAWIKPSKKPLPHCS